MRDRVMTVMAAVFGMPREALSDEMALGSTACWDSFRHLKLIMALEDEFGVTFDVEQIVTMTGIASILQALAQKRGIVGRVG